jgi:hypothetical protein
MSLFSHPQQVARRMSGRYLAVQLAAAPLLALEKGRGGAGRGTGDPFVV